MFTTLGYQGERLGTSLELRWYEGGKIDNTRIAGAATAQGANINHVGSTAYTNLSMSYDLAPMSDNDLSVYLRVNNLFDRAPPFPNTGGLGIFDEVGRAYRLGVRFGF